MDRGANTESNQSRWLRLLLGPTLSLVGFLAAFYLDPLQFAATKPVAAIPAFLVSILILLVDQNIKTTEELRKASFYSDRVYDAVKNYLHVTTVGSPEKALSYISSRISVIREANNTSFNTRDETERSDEKFYETENYRDLADKVILHCNKGLLWKDIGDEFAVGRFRYHSKVTRSSKKKETTGYKYKFITHAEPQINFIILEYNDGAKEVLFNWDFRGAGQDPIVLLSRDRQIVEMFATQFNLLWRCASTDHDSTEIRSVSST